jgi:hypothetical protein
MPIHHEKEKKPKSSAKMATAAKMARHTHGKHHDKMADSEKEAHKNKKK